MIKKKVGTINCAPTPTAYAQCLITILEEGTNQESKEWARQEIIRLTKYAARLNPEAWEKEK